MSSEILRESTWGIMCRRPWCWLLLWWLQFIRTGLGWILDFW